MMLQRVKMRIITARNANMKVNGVSIEKREKKPKNNWELLSLRNHNYFSYNYVYIEHSNMDGENLMII